MRHVQSVPVMTETSERQNLGSGMASSVGAAVNVSRQASKASDGQWKRRTFTDGMEADQLMQEAYLDKLITHNAAKTISFVPNLGPLFSSSQLSQGESQPFQALQQRRLSRSIAAIPKGERTSVGSERDIEDWKMKNSRLPVCLQKVVASFPGPGSVRGGVFNLASATLGAGALALPQAFAYTGVPLGAGLLIFMCLVTAFSIRLLLWTADALQGKVPNISYEDISVFCFGKVFGRVVEINIILFCFGAAVGYIIAAATYVAPLVYRIACGEAEHNTCSVGGGLDWMFDSPNPGSTLYKMIVVLFVTFVMFPLSLIDKMNTLRFTSFIGVASIFYLILAVTGDSLGHTSDYSTGEILGESVSFSGVMQAIPTIMFAFTCQVNVFSIYQELNNPTAKRMIKVSDRACMLCCTLYGLIGVFGFLRFSNLKYDWDTAKGNILTNYQLTPRSHDCAAPHWVNNCWDVLKLSQLTSNIPLVLGELAITVTILLAFPLNIFPCRYTCEVVIASWRGAPIADTLPVIEEGKPQLEEGLISACEDSELDEVVAKGSRCGHFMLTLLIVGLAMLCAAFIPSIQTVFSLLGSTCSAFVCYVVPAMFQLKVAEGPWYSSTKLPAWILLIGGTVMGVACTIIIIINL